MKSETRLEKLLSMLEDDPNDSFLIFAIAKEHEKTGNYKEAILKYQFIVSEDPEYVGSYYHLAKLHEIEKESDLAVAIYKEGIAMCKKVGDIHSMAELTTALANLEMDID